MPPPFPALEAVLHATIIAVAAFLIFFTTGYTRGRTHQFGIVLGIWLCVLSVAALALGIADPLPHPWPACERIPRQISPVLPKLNEH